MRKMNQKTEINDINKNAAKSEFKIPIFLASDNNYSPFVATTILSIVKNTSSFIAFYILDGGILKSNKKKILSLQKKHKNFSVEFINMKRFELNKFPEIKHYTTNAFSRYFIPELKPDLGKVLYLDVDIIVTGDIAELYNQDLGEYYLGAILEDYCPFNYTYLKKICPGYKGGCNYFNSGVLVMDLDGFRRHNIAQKLVETTTRLNDLLNCPDQDVLNLIFENNFKKIDYKFNFFSGHEKYVDESGKKELLEARENHLILHFTGGKPWLDKSVEMSYKFWDIVKETPFYDGKNLSFSKSFKERFKFISYKKIKKNKLFIKLYIRYIFLLLGN